MRAQEEVYVYMYSTFNIGARQEWMVNPTFRSLYSRKIPGTHCMGG